MQLRSDHSRAEAPLKATSTTRAMRTGREAIGTDRNAIGTDHKAIGTDHKAMRGPATGRTVPMPGRRALVGLATATTMALLLATANAPAVAAHRPHPGQSHAKGASSSSSVATPGSAASYVSAPNLHPAKVKVDVNLSGKAAGDIFLDPAQNSAKPIVGEPGALILENSGAPVWFRPTLKGEGAFDLEQQTYKGHPVLTWWQGNVAIPPRFTNLPEGSPEPGGRYFIYNQHYKRLKTIYGQEGWTADLHEFKLTPRGTALFLAYKTVPMDLTRYGGSATGAVEDAEVQEVSLSTGKLLFKWDMLEHIPLSDAEAPAPATGIWDAYHANSLQEVPGGKLLISARNTWAIYEVERKNGNVLWQLGGKESSFALSAQAHFSWQHDARLDGNTITMFDDACCGLLPTGLGPAEDEAHGLQLSLNLANHTATAVHQYTHNPSLNVPSQGDLQQLGNGNFMVGWGQLPYYSEYTSSGKLVYAASLPEADDSYRIQRFTWTGKPLSKPSAVARRSGSATKLYMSWNGATMVRSWEVLSAGTVAGLKTAHPAKKASRKGFETVLTTAAKGPYFEVKALGGKGRVLGTSKVLTASQPGKGSKPSKGKASKEAPKEEEPSSIY